MSTIKTLKALLLVMVVSAFMSACGGSTANDPKSVAEAFLTAMNNQNYDKAKKYATEGSQESLETMSKMAEMAAGLSDEKPEPKEIVVGESEVDGDNAVVHYTEDGNDMTLDLVKEDGNWKAKFDKMGGLMDDIGDSSEGLDSLNEALDSLTDSVDTVIDDMNEAVDSLSEIIDDAN